MVSHVGYDGITCHACGTGASEDQTWEHQKTKQHAWLDTSTPIKRGRKRVNSDCSHALALEQTLEPTKHF